ncbi:MAG: lysophospholipase [Desulfosporosinus sp.]|nr:lysophospholipase [Desulfosporosinus sp.]
MNNKLLCIQTEEGIRIYYYKQIPLDAKGLILISHGFGEHLGLYEEFMDFLLKNGYGVFAYDHRAHGHSEEERGHIDRFEFYIEDMAVVVRYLKQEYQDLPLFMFGHSMGGLIAFNYGILHPEGIQGQIFTGPAVGRPVGTGFIPESLFNLLEHYWARVKIYSFLARKGTRNKVFRAKLKNDPYVLKYGTVGFYCEFLNRGIASAKGKAMSYRLPVLFLHGKADRIIPYRASTEIFAQISSEDKTLKLYEGLYHELVREPEREEVWQDILAWLELRRKILLN